MDCLSCKSNLENIYNFGSIPLVNNFLKNKKNSNKKYKLNLVVCKKCNILQLKNTPSEKIIFNTYKHISSASKDNVKHLYKVANLIRKKYKNKKTKVLEVGSNDGTLLKILSKYNFDCTGVEPAKNLKKFYNKNIYLINDFFSKKIKNRLNHDSYDVIIGLNVFAHFKQVQDAFTFVEKILSKNGVFIFEVAYADTTIMKSNFDTVYHEHVFNHTCVGIKNMLKISNLNLDKIQKIETQGGSLRVFACKNKKDKRENKLLKKELTLGFNKYKTYKKIGYIIKKKIELINKTIEKNISQNSNTLLVGAPARGVIFSNSTKIKKLKKIICVDDSKTKHGCYFPGLNIKVQPTENIRLISKNCNQAILLSWNYKKTMIEKLKKNNFKGKVLVFSPKIEKIKL